MLPDSCVVIWGLRNETISRYNYELSLTDDSPLMLLNLGIWTLIWILITIIFPWPSGSKKIKLDLSKNINYLSVACLKGCKTTNTHNLHPPGIEPGFPEESRFAIYIDKKNPPSSKKQLFFDREI